MSQTFRVFYYEDDDEVAEETKNSLERLPSRPGLPSLKVTRHAKSWDAFRAIEQGSGKPPDVALLDIHEDGDPRAGIDICKRIKENWPKVPVIMLSDFATVRDQTDGYGAGAAAYLSKSLWKEKDCGQLVRTVLMRHISTVQEITDYTPSVYRNGSLQVDMNVQKVRWREKLIRLSVTDVDIVDELASDRDKGGLRTYARLAAIGGLRAESREQMRINVNKHMSNIRKAFRKVDEEFGKAGYGIISVPGRGYRWQTDELHDGDGNTGQ